jgi:CBS domain-containing protein
MRVSEVMHTPIVATSPSATLREVSELMRSHNVGCVAILDQLGYLTGIITDRDVAIRGVAEGRSPDAPVDAVMTRDVATVPPNADLSTARAIMHKRGIRRLPVTDELWRPHGMIALDDLLRAVSDEVDAVADTVAAQQEEMWR